MGTLTLSHERRSAQMSKITNDGLTQSDTGCFIAVYPYGNSGRQSMRTSIVFSAFWASTVVRTFKPEYRYCIYAYS